MLAGSEEGKKWSLRAKIDYQHKNGSMRDPVVYRYVDGSHHITGSVVFPPLDSLADMVAPSTKLTPCTISHARSSIISTASRTLCARMSITLGMSSISGSSSDWVCLRLKSLISGGSLGEAVI